MVKNDRMTMAHSIEARVPFCDRDLVAFLATVPVEYFMKGLKPKQILKSAVSDLLPRPILKRKKMGLEMPYSSWMRGPLSDFVSDTLHPDRLKRIGLFNPEPVQILLADHQQMKMDNGRSLWGLVNYVLWHELFIQSNDGLSATVARPFH
jgi:asparagine synthase (glutamine-hydrolysing)